MNFEHIELNQLEAETFGKVAETWAEKIHHNSKNKSSQLRRYYDELVMWNDKVQQTDDYVGNVPFIKMMKAKVAYAKGRDLVDENFQKMFNRIIDEIEDKESLRNAKLFFEAVLGFRKALENTKTANPQRTGR